MPFMVGHNDVMDLDPIWASLLSLLLVALVATVSGALAIPLGIVLGLHPLVVYIVATATAIAVTWTLLLGGHRVRSMVARGVGHGDHSVKRTGDLVARFGSIGLGLVGPLFPGVIASTLSGMALEIDSRHLGRWMTVGIAAWFAVFTAVSTAIRLALVG
jgi:hypothetical protein